MPGTANDIKFLLWLLLVTRSSSCFALELDVQCLKTVKQSVIDPNDILKSSWNFDNGTVGYICRFTGVECWPDENRVLSLRLGNLGLEGQFPRGLEYCTSMTELDLSSNKFSGPIPSNISRLLPYMTSIDLSSNAFSGEIPRSIGNMSYLNILGLEHNQLTGQIPEEIGHLTRLTGFNVADNSLSGPIPASLQIYGEASFAGNGRLCGPPLDRRCKRRFRLRRVNDASSIGAAAGFVVGFVVAFYFPHCFVFSRRLHPYILKIC